MATDPLRRAGEPPPEWAAGARVAGYFEAHGRMVYGLCRALLREPVEAEDASQATFVSAYRALLGGGDVRDPAAWLAAIARNECRSRAVARMREPLAFQESDAVADRGPEEELDRRRAAEEIRAAIAELPDRQREAVVLRDLYGMRYDEVGSALGLSRASVESLLFRARRQLRVRLKPLASGAIVVPLAVREGIAQALPGFAAAGSGSGMLAAGAAAGTAGGGLFAGLASFTTAPVVAKLAVATVAIGAAGSATLAGSDRAAQADVPSRKSRVAAVAMADPAKVLALGDAARSRAAAPSVRQHDRGGAAPESGESRERVGPEERGPGRGQGGEHPSRAESSGPTGSEDGGRSGSGERDHGAAAAASGGDGHSGSDHESSATDAAAVGQEASGSSGESSAAQTATAAAVPEAGRSMPPADSAVATPSADSAVSAPPADEAPAPEPSEKSGPPSPPEAPEAAPSD